RRTPWARTAGMPQAPPRLAQQRYSPAGWSWSSPGAWGTVWGGYPFEDGDSPSEVTVMRIATGRGTPPRRSPLRRRDESVVGVLEDRIRQHQRLGGLLRLLLLQQLRQALIHDAVGREDPLGRLVHPAARAVPRRRVAVVHLERERLGARHVHVPQALDPLDAVGFRNRILVQLAHEPLALEIAREAELI